MTASRNSNDAITETPLPLLLDCPYGKPDGWEMGASGKHPLRVVRESELDSFMDSAQTTDWTSRDPAEKHLVDVLLETVVSGEKLMRIKNVERVIAKIPTHALPKPEDLSSPVIDFSVRVRLGVANSRIVVWWSRQEKRFLLGLHCGAIPYYALYLLAFARLGKSGGWTKCENELCPKWFKRRHKKERRFCNSNCRSAFTMRRLRAKARKKALIRASAKETHGTGKTR